MITGKDAATGKKRSRLVGAAWTALNFVPVSKVAKLAKAAKVLATAKKAEKVAKNGGRIKRAARATKLAMKRAAEKLAKRKPAKKAAKKAAEKARKTKKVKHAKNVRATGQAKHEATHRAGTQLSKAKAKLEREKAAKHVKNVRATGQAKHEATHRAGTKLSKAKAKLKNRIGKVHFDKDDESKTIRNHIYKNTEGHFPNWSQEHDDTLLRVAQRKSNFKRMDIHGNDWYAETIKDNKQIWVRVRDGKITDGGINSRPVPVMKDGMHKVSWYIKNGVKLP
ncbi:hypothetical protein P3T69_11640 [Lactiplantibacillus plantarum]|nr:hypothetical protein P3T69_11640 [Lactiplantibacillus plantarum]